MALLPSLGAMRAELALSYGELGIVVGAFGLARLLVDLPAGGLARRWNPRKVLLIAFAVSGLGSALGALTANAWQIAGVRLLIGVASSIAQAMILAWLVGGTGRVARGRVMARGEALFSVAGLIVPALGGVLASQLSWRVAFVMGAIAAAIGFAAVFAFTRATGAARSVALEQPPSATIARPLTVNPSPGSRSPSRSPAPEPQNFFAMWRDLRLGGHILLSAYVATFVVFFCRNGLLNAVLPLMGTDRLGIEPFQIGILFSTINALSIGAVLLGGRAGDRFGRYRLLGPGLAILLVAQLALFLIHDPLTYVIIGLLQGLSFFVNPLPTVLLGDSLPARVRPQGIAVYRAVSDLALLCAPSVMGAALQAGGFQAAEQASVAVIGIALAFVVAIYVRHGSADRYASPADRH
jgi:MFS family permease